MIGHISQQQLESYLWGAATLLRGTIDAGDYKQFIFPLLFLKRLCDVFDEETQTALAESGGDREYALFPENHRFQIPPEAHWREVRTDGNGAPPLAECPAPVLRQQSSRPIKWWPWKKKSRPVCWSAITEKNT